MKILHVISYGYVAGGAEKSVLLLKQQLQRRGHEVKVISSDHGKDSPAKRFSDIKFPEIDSPGTSLIAKMVKHLWYVPSYRVITRATLEFKPDIVHFHIMGQLSPSAIFAAGSVPSVLTVHGPEEYVSGLLEWSFPKRLFKDDKIAISQLTALGRGYNIYFRWLQRPLYIAAFRKHLQAMIAPSQYMAGVLADEKYGVSIHHIYNGIVLPEPHPMRRKRQLLYVGRLEHVKGVDVLLEAMQIVARKLPGIHLAIVGDGTVRPHLEAYARQHHLEPHVTFHGWLDARAVKESYSRTTAVVIPSIWPENLPTVCIEALAVGRPVIGSNVGGIPELIKDGVTGRIVAKGNADELAAAIIDIVTRPNLAAMGAACTASMQNFSVATFTENLEQLYNHLIDRKNV